MRALNIDACKTRFIQEPGFKVDLDVCGRMVLEAFGCGNTACTQGDAIKHQVQHGVVECDAFSGYNDAQLITLGDVMVSTGVWNKDKRAVESAMLKGPFKKKR